MYYITYNITLNWITEDPEPLVNVYHHLHTPAPGLDHLALAQEHFCTILANLTHQNTTSANLLILLRPTP